MRKLSFRMRNGEMKPIGLGFFDIIRDGHLPIDLFYLILGRDFRGPTVQSFARCVANNLQLMLVGLGYTPAQHQTAFWAMFSPDNASRLERLLGPRVTQAAFATNVLEAAADADYAETVRFMLQNLPALHAGMALPNAALMGSIGVVRELLASGMADPREYDNSAIRIATIHNQVAIVELMLADPRVDPRARDNEAIRMSACHGYDAIVRMLLDDGRANPAAKNSFALFLAGQNGHSESAAMLLRDGRADPVLCNALAACLFHRDNDHVLRIVLADPRVNPADQGSLALRRAIMYGHIRSLRLLLEDGRSRLEDLDQDLMEGARVRHPRVIDILNAHMREPGDAKQLRLFGQIK